MPGSCIPGNWDFYSPRKNLAQVLAFFIDTQGYLLDNKDTKRRQYGKHNHGLRSVYFLHHSENPEVKLNVIQSSTESPHAPLCFFHSTPVMNFVSGTGLGMMYPALTTQHEGMFLLQPRSREFNHGVTLQEC